MAAVRKLKGKSKAKAPSQIVEEPAKPGPIVEAPVESAKEGRHTGNLHAAGQGESPESHPGKFDTFGNPN